MERRKAGISARVKLWRATVLTESTFRSGATTEAAWHRSYLVVKGLGRANKIGSTRMLCEALERKLEAEKNHLPKILLLLDRYHCADAESWTNAAREINFDGFHAVAQISARCIDTRTTFR